MLSIIIPFCNEYPQVAFTVRAVAEELRGRMDFEIIAVDNYCEAVGRQGFHKDKGAAVLRAATEGNSWLKVLTYDARASHWQAKNLGVAESTGKLLLFLDAHAIPGRDSIYPMVEYFRAHHQALNGSLHLPLTYQILEWRKLIYKLDVDLELGKLQYMFDDFRPSDQPYKVPAMSSCGMLVSRETYDKLGGWPTPLGSWGGGENFFNFALATMGKNVWIWPGGTLYHHGEKRGYWLDKTDIVTNRCIAVFIVGGLEMAQRYMSNVHGTGSRQGLVWKDKILTKVRNACCDHRELIKPQQTVLLHDWLKRWGKK